VLLCVVVVVGDVGMMVVLWFVLFVMFVDIIAVYYCGVGVTIAFCYVHMCCCCCCRR